MYNQDFSTKAFMRTYTDINKLVAKGRSVVFVADGRGSTDERDTKLYLEHLATKFRSTGIPVLQHEGVPLQTLNAWNLGEQYKPNGVLLVQVPLFATGVRLRADRAVWVGRVPEETSYRYGIYSQSMSRCDSATRMCDRFHYLSGELQGA